MRHITLRGRGDLEEWRVAARALAIAGVASEEVEWHAEAEDGGLFRHDGEMPLPASSPDAAPLTVPPAFIELANAVICHSDPARFMLLYRLLVRLQADRRLLEQPSDEDVVRARLMEKSVRRDAHKMTAFVRFKEVGSGISVNGRRKFLAWFEPDHYIVGRKASFFQRRFNDMDWIILTPKGSAGWDGKTLTIGDDSCEKPDLSDAADELWRTYYANIFNPARLKVKAMQAEMPKKYWKNLPEADLIPGLIANAESQVLAMAKREATRPLPFHERLQEAARNAPGLPVAEAGTWESLREAAATCTRCPLHGPATQTVFGEGPRDAVAVFVGEQPGDQEDLAGRPFVGPAGSVFDQALVHAGIARSTIYVTNAVKHFKYEPRGKRRIHQRPNMGEVKYCRWWLEQELELIAPKLVVAMGATAVASLADGKFRFSDIRGEALATPDGRVLFTTVHPSYLLRLPDPAKKAEETDRFLQDMLKIQRLIESISQGDSIASIAR
ncbi:UdgX family uracil-DNA binding protein [Rhizobium grahamii]|uniref:Type-4 uracil-DNA glycosylase n=1 Tax=Rhizobium grahamii TaxID=1120045 RepID=A0A5Q0C4A1_9HYPH|nr:MULTISPECIES: UdgX family uracil-DNA binding protein [Rhizobium]QFY60738.1 UdgX family uracil-DNA binding protein [Rhizobium grahamii]QRM50120.1 UdgX family uracil-DNA binding protein [Rhizobium sp. BG6]